MFTETHKPVLSDTTNRERAPCRSELRNKAASSSSQHVQPQPPIRPASILKPASLPQLDIPEGAVLVQHRLKQGGVIACIQRRGVFLHLPRKQVRLLFKLHEVLVSRDGDATIASHAYPVPSHLQKSFLLAQRFADKVTSRESSYHDKLDDTVLFTFRCPPHKSTSNRGVCSVGRTFYQVDDWTLDERRQTVKSNDAEFPIESLPLLDLTQRTQDAIARMLALRSEISRRRLAFLARKAAPASGTVPPPPTEQTPPFPPRQVLRPTTGFAKFVKETPFFGRTAPLIHKRDDSTISFNKRASLPGLGWVLRLSKDERFSYLVLFADGEEMKLDRHCAGMRWHGQESDATSADGKLAARLSLAQELISHLERQRQ